MSSGRDPFHTPGSLSSEERLADMDRAIRNTYGKLPEGQDRSGRERVTWVTGLHEVMEKEESAQREATVLALDKAQRLLDLPELPEVLVAKVREVVLMIFAEMTGVWIDFFFKGAQANPLEVLKRVFAWVKHQRPDLIANMGVRDLGLLFGESHGAVAYRLMMLFGEVPSGYQKPREARVKMAQAAKGNKCRLGGKKARQAIEGKKSEVGGQRSDAGAGA